MENKEDKIFLAKLRKVTNFEHDDLSLITHSIPIKGYFFIEQVDERGWSYISITDNGEKKIENFPMNVNEFVFIQKYSAKNMFPNLFQNKEISVEDLKKIEEQSISFNDKNIVKKCLKIDEDFEENQNEF